ncbi:uncharacterized protein LOC118207137 isoform X2 [Anguilla anguilla]|uniref:uncharacterized protein LOC118207137 isoform X2 n=1 Tax=Anguilla anguilla TaxID=7936 RepID=UPI0015B1671A|nr:uncharacterized protein LOC118207137 isoform X2 [Anguilla anguilla]
MAFKPEQEVQPENIEMIGCPVQESSCVKTRPWPSSDKQSHNHPGAADTMGINSKPVFAHDEGLTVCEMTEDAEGVEEGKMEKKAEEKVAEAKLGVLCSPEGMPRSCLSQEAEPQSPTMAEHKPRPDGSTAEGHIKVTDRIAGQKKVFRKRQKAKPKMQTAEAAGTEGGPQNTRAPFRLQDFMCSKISKCYTVLLLLDLLAFPVNSNETPKKRMCAVCLEKDCATGVRIIYLAGSDTLVWSKASSPTGIQNCSMENLKPDAPCKMANGSLVQLANETLHFEGMNAHTFKSQISPCADLNLPPSSTLSPRIPHLAPMTKAPIRNTSPPAATNNSGSGIGIGGGIGIFIIGIVIGIGIGIGIGFLIGKRNSCGQGQDGDHRHGNNGVPPPDAEDRDEITIEIQPLNAEVANGNVNEGPLRG